MRRRPLLVVVWLASLGACSDGTTSDSAPPAATVELCDVAAGVVSTTLAAAGITYDVRIYIPSVAAQSTVLPVVLNWHANGMTGPIAADHMQYEALAEQEGFIVVHPSGHELPGVPVLENGLSWELIDGLESPAVDDLAFANALIDELIANWCADAEHIFSIGYSNGSFFTSAMVCELADRLAGAGAVAGMYHPDSCEPSRAVPYIAFHGVSDAVVPYETGGETVYPALNEVMFKLGTFDAFAAFAAEFGCESKPTESEVGGGVTRYDYLSCDAPMVFYAFEASNGHSWPGAPSDQSTTHEISATLVSWQFFEALL